MADSNSENVDLIAELSREAEQEEEIRTGSSSYLTHVDSRNLVNREREYRDLEKQWVRHQWRTSVSAVVAKNGRPARYLTLPAYYRLDISLFNETGLLATKTIDGVEVLEVAAFETDPTKYARMVGHQPPLLLFGNTPIEDALVDHDNRYYAELASLFPFDVVNLDLTTSLTPKHEGPFSKIMQAIEQVMLRQATHVGEWALFLTFRNVLDEWQTMALNAFVENMQENIDKYPRVRDAFTDRYPSARVQTAMETEAERCVAQCVLKWLVDRAHYHHMQLVDSVSYHYTRYPGIGRYDITKLVTRFSRGSLTDKVIPMKESPVETWVEADLVGCVQKNKFANVEDILLGGPEERLISITEEISRLANLIDEDSGARIEL